MPADVQFLSDKNITHHCTT